MDTSPRTHRFLPVEAMTSSRQVTGKIMVTSTGAFGILNDPIQSVLEIHDVRTAPLGAVDGPADHFEMLRLVKTGLSLVLVSRKEDLGPQALVRGGYTNIVEYPVRIDMHMFELEGIAEFLGRFDFAALLTTGSREFVPLYNASIRGTLTPGLNKQAAGVLFNRRHIDLIGLLNQKVRG